MTNLDWRLAADLRSWQRSALDAWKKNADRGVVAVVTGGGKTIFAYAAMLDLLRRRPDAHFIIVVPTTALLDQWIVGLTEDLRVSSTDIAAFSGSERPSSPRRVNVMVINTARVVAPRISAELPAFLIVDECHRAASLVNARALAGEHIASLGLSATPERDFDDLFNENVVPALGPVIYRYGYDEARTDGVITPFSLVNVRVPLLPDEQARYDAFTRRLFPLFKKRERGDDVDFQLTRILQERARVSYGAAARIPATLRLVTERRRERAIVFHEQIAAADEITTQLRAAKHRAAAYHSGLGPHLRQDNLRMFRRGEIDVLVTCRALDEGINVPNASVAVIAASTSSTRQRIQRLGRVLRPAPGKEAAEIFTLYASEPEAQRLKQEAESLAGVRKIEWLETRVL